MELKPVLTLHQSPLQPPQSDNLPSYLSSYFIYSYPFIINTCLLTYQSIFARIWLLFQRIYLSSIRTLYYWSQHCTQPLFLSFLFTNMTNDTISPIIYYSHSHSYSCSRHSSEQWNPLTRRHTPCRCHSQRRPILTRQVRQPAPWFVPNTVFILLFHPRRHNISNFHSSKEVTPFF